MRKRFAFTAAVGAALALAACGVPGGDEEGEEAGAGAENEEDEGGDED